MHQTKTLNHWQRINGHIFWYRLLAVVSFILSSFLCFLLFVELTNGPIVIVKKGESVSYHAGARENVAITEEAVSSFIAHFVRTRYTWEEFDPEKITGNLSCITTEGFLFKLKESLGKEKHTEGKGQRIEQYAAHIRPRLEEGKSFAGIPQKRGTLFLSGFAPLFILLWT